jgi:hypothetical protein
MAILESRLGVLPAVLREPLGQHLSKCRACGAEYRRDLALDLDLAMLRLRSPTEVDVTARVLREIAELRPRRGREVRGWQLVGATAAAAAALAAVLLVAVQGIPTLLPGALWEVRLLLGGSATVVPALTRPLTGLRLALKSLGGVALDLLEAATRVAHSLAPVSQAMMALCLAAMASVATFVIARDLRLLRHLPSGKEPRR